MKKNKNMYPIPVTWEMCGYVYGKGRTVAEAAEYVTNHEDLYDLPKDASFVDGSFGVTGTRNEDELITISENAEYLIQEGKLLYVQMPKTPKTITEILNDELSPDNLGNFTPTELAQYLIKIGIIENAVDMNRIVIEKVQEVVTMDDEIPIVYYDKDHDIPEEHKYPDPGVCLTDEYIETMMNND